MTMTFDYFMPADCTGTTLDDYLKEAWFRDGPMMSRYEMIYFREHVYSIVPIRVVLEDFQFSKSQRKLIRKNQGFKVKIQPLEITPIKEKMYAEHKGRFQSPNSPSTLKNYFQEEGNDESPFETWELQILDGNHLAAISFIDIGEESICSILALFDPAYSKQSLGITSMLFEIEYAQMSNKKYYYPGYVLDEDSVFDYKKRLNNLQFFSWKNFSWHSWNLFEKEETSNLLIREKLDDVVELFEEAKKMEIDVVQNEAFFYNVWHNTFDVSGIVPSPLYLEWESTWFQILTIDYTFDEEEKDYFYTLRHTQSNLYVCQSAEEISDALRKWQLRIRNAAIIQQQSLYALEEILFQEGIQIDPTKMFSNGNKLDGFIEMAIEGKHLTMYISYYCDQKIFTLQASNDLRDITIDSFATARDCARAICEWINRKTLSIVL